MKKTPLVSIIINCLNGEKYLDKALKSVFNQIYTNWEIIFFDNNSTDKSYSILKKYKDKRIKYFKSKKIYKLYKARNLAVKKCKGKMVTFLDVDDWWAKNKLKKQVDFFLKYQTTEILYSNVYVYSEKKKKYTLNTLAKEFNTNSSYLSSIINSTKDANFSSYLNNLRIDYAIDKLKKDKKFRIYTIKAIAEEVGFNTSQSFTNAFYKKTRLYPSFFIAKIKKM